MANLLDSIKGDLVAALKLSDATAVSTLRFLLAAIQNARIEKGGELTEGEILSQIQKDAKRHKESIEAFKAGGREDLVSKENAELEILNKYLPAQMSEEQVAKIVEEVIAQTGASSAGDIGKVMGGVMAKIGTQADGGTVSQIVKLKLAK